MDDLDKRDTVVVVVEEEEEEEDCEGEMPETEGEDMPMQEMAAKPKNCKSLKVGDRSLEIDQVIYRSVSIDRAMINEESRTVEFPCSSEYPVERWWGSEVLEHTAEAIDLSRFNNGANLLYNHSSRDYLGVILSSYLRSGKLYCKVEFDTHNDAEKIWRSVTKGILRNVSIGYSIESMREEVNKGHSTYIATRWCPMEVSIVTVPADPTVGIGRSLVEETPQPIQPATPTEPEQKVPITQNKYMDERERILSIQALCRQHGISDDLVGKWINDGTSIDEVRALVLDHIQRSKPTQEPIATPVNPLGLTEKEQRQYSVCKAILAQVDPTYRAQAGFEREISDEISKKLGRSTSGFFIPVRDLRVPWAPIDPQQRATYAVGASATGGVTVETMLDAANLIEYLRNRALVMRMGARMLSGLQGILDIPRQTGVASTYWVGEGGAVSQSESTFDKITFTPKTVGVKSRMTRLMLLQSSIDIEAFVRQDISQSIALEIDRTVINGSGTSNQPAGLLSSGVGLATISLGTNGGAPTWDAIVQAETNVSAVNADIGALGWMTTPQVRGKLKRTLKNPSASNSDWIWENGSDPLIGNLNGYMAGVTNQVPANLTKGTGTNLSAAIFGNWNDIMIGEWGVLELLANPYGAGYDSGDIEVRAMQTIDIQIRRTASFNKIVDIITT